MASKKIRKLKPLSEANKSYIRNPDIIWYGPHQCNMCGNTIVQSSYQQGGVQLDASDINHNYPNYEWQLHKCSPPIPDEFPKPPFTT